jgi:phosphopantetheine--protein transferase-like protein
MIHGIGVDILGTARLESLRGKYDDPFFGKTYTAAELEAGIKKPDPVTYFAGRFAAKEAVFKALGVSAAGFRPDDVETLNDDTGKPYVVLYGEAKKHMESAGIRQVFISLSNEKSLVSAYAVCEK